MNPAGPRRCRPGAAAGWLAAAALRRGPDAGRRRASRKHGKRAQLRSTTQQLQQMQSEQAQVNAAKAAAEAQRDAAQKELEALRGQLARAQGQAEKLSQQQSAVLESAQSQIAASNAQLGKFKGAYDELLVLARTKESERAKLAGALPSATSRSRAASPRTARCTRPARTS